MSDLSVAAAILGELAEPDAPLAPYTTYRLGGAASLLVRARDVDDLVRVGVAHRESGLPVLAIGRGSNLLVADAGFRGIAVLTGELATGASLMIETDDDVAASVVHPGEISASHGDAATVTVGAGLALPVVARRLAAAGWRGFEWAVGVPGSIGGAVRMNAGGHGSDIAACVVDADVVDLAADASPGGVSVGGAVTRRPAEALGFGFRTSALGAGEVVVAARLRVVGGDPKAAEAEVSEIVRWRREHQPGGQNAGSVFVNPVPGEVSAGLLIDRLGLRGLRHGTAHVSEKHANFIQGANGGSADDVRALMELVRSKVADATGFELRSEIRLVGFPDTVGAAGAAAPTPLGSSR